MSQADTQQRLSPYDTVEVDKNRKYCFRESREMWFGGRERNKLLEQIKERRIKQGKSCVANTKDKRVSES